MTMLHRVAVEELSEGDWVDLENDPYADAEGFAGLHDEAGSPFQFEYAVVYEVQKTLKGVTVEFDAVTVLFPYGHGVLVETDHSGR